MSPTLWTSRLRLDPIAPEEGTQLLALFRDPAVRRFLLDDVFVDAEWMARELFASAARFARGSVGLFAAHPKASGGELLGFAGLRPYRSPDDLQLLYAVEPAWGGRGLATEMVDAALQYAFEHAGMESVVASVDVPNVASSRLLERLGFRLRGREPGPRFELLIFELDALAWQRRAQ